MTSHSILQLYKGNPATYKIFEKNTELYQEENSGKFCMRTSPMKV
jgi:hypothetical protein